MAAGGANPRMLPRAVALVALALPGGVQAQTVAMDPLNRVHLGASLVQGPVAPGLSVGMDSRMTRLVFVDAGGFSSPVPLEAEDELEGTDAEALRLRHGLYLGPGLRIPHAQPAAFRFDLVLRGGMSVVWLADLTEGATDRHGPPFRHVPEVAGFGGVDLTLLRGPVGLRGGYRHYFMAPYLEDEGTDVLVNRGQVTVEATVQFGGAR